MHRTVHTGPAAALVLCALALSVPEVRARDTAPDPPPARGPVFERDVLPIVREHCWKCHGAEARKSGLDLRTPAGALKGGASGEPALVPGKPEASPMFELLSTGKMPHALEAS